MGRVQVTPFARPVNPLSPARPMLYTSRNPCFPGPSMRPLARLLLVLVLAILACPALAETEGEMLPPPLAPPPLASPLAPIDTSSPRATVAALYALGADLDAAYTAYRDGPSFSGQLMLRRILARSDRLFDLSQTPIATRSEAGQASFGFMKDILMRIPAIDPAILPGDGATAPDRLWLPGTDIEIVRIPSGPGAGAFLFSADSVARLPQLHALVIDMPVLNPAPYDSWREQQVRFTGPLVPGALVRAIPEPLEVLVLGTPAWKLVATLVLAAVALCLATLWTLLALRRAEVSAPIPAQAWRLTIPTATALLAMALRSYVLGQINLSGAAFHGFQVATLLAVVLSLALAARQLITLAGELIVAAPGVGRHGYDVHLLRLVSRVSGLAAAAGVIVYGANMLGVPLLGLVAGVGVGGLALALAAQSTVENLFGGVSIFADRPFRVGDFIIYDGGQGYVESIGPRSTRIRALDGMQITVPNADLARMQVTNKTCRDATLFEHLLRFTYDATPDQIADFSRRTVATLSTYPLDADAPVPPRVRIVGLGDFSIDVQVHAEMVARSEDDFYRLQELLLLEIMAIAAACGLEFAFPTQTLQLTRSPALGAA